MMKKYLPNFSSGFTIIELLIVFAIIAALSSISLASYVTYSRQQTVDQAANDLINTLNTAKSDAYTQKKPDVPACNSGLLHGFQVNINISAGEYYLQAVCTGGAPYTLSTTTLPAGQLNFDNSSVTNVFFQVLSGSVNGTGNIIIHGYNNAYTRTISVDSAGVIQ